MEVTFSNSYNLPPITEIENVKWYRVLNMGRHSHVIEDGKTLCGRSISLSKTIIRKYPSKKCMRCLTIVTMYLGIERLKIPA